MVGREEERNAKRVSKVKRHIVVDGTAHYKVSNLIHGNSRILGALEQ